LASNLISEVHELGKQGFFRFNLSLKPEGVFLSEGIILNEKHDVTEPKYVPLDFSEVLGNSLRYWLKNLKSFWMIFFAIQLAIVAIAYGAFFLSSESYMVAQIANELGAVIPSWFIINYFIDVVSTAMVVVLGAILIINIGIQTLLTGMVIRHTKDHHVQQIPTLGESFSHSRNRFWSLLGAQILIILITLALAIGGGFLMTLIGIGFLFALGIFGMLLGLVIGLVVFVILIVYITTRLAVVIPAVILDGESAGGSIGRSWNLVGGNWWRTFGVNFIIGIVTLLVGLPTTIVASMITLSFLTPSLTMILMLIYVPVSAIMSGFTNPIAPTTSTMIYHDLMGRQFGPLDTAQPGVVARRTGMLHQYNECPVCKQAVSGRDRFCGQCGRDLTI
jgi:membrane-anchored glycerophosphoryl diester phosphodiesterase (GDPDase)